MKVFNQLLILSAAIVGLGLGAQNAAAQPNGGGGNFGGGNFGGGNGNFDPQQMMQQMQQRQVDNIREQLEITNDTDWSAIEPLLSKVMQGSTVDYRACVEIAAAGREYREGGEDRVAESPAFLAASSPTRPPMR